MNDAEQLAVGVAAAMLALWDTYRYRSFHDPHVSVLGINNNDEGIDFRNVFPPSKFAKPLT